MAILSFVAGLVFLIVGAEALVRGASRLAATLAVSPLIIGLTVVAFGTSSPELAVSVGAALSGQANIVMGSVVGSNIFNVLFILGLSAMVTPLLVSQQLVRFDVPVMIILSVVLLGLAWDSQINRWDGLVLFSGLIIYIWFSIWQSRREYEQALNPGSEANNKHWFVNLALMLGGLTLLVIGSGWLVDSAIKLAHLLGVSDLIIGLTIVAAGTSLPEVVTSVIASLRGERDIAVGNIVGSNLFNIMGVLGLAGIVSGGGITVSPSVIYFDLPVMIAVAFACLPIFFTGGKISRWEGVLLLGYYCAYTLYLILAAMHYASLPFFSNTMFYYVIPLTILTLAIVTVNAIRSKP